MRREGRADGDIAHANDMGRLFLGDGRYLQPLLVELGGENFHPTPSAIDASKCSRKNEGGPPLTA